MPRVKIQVVMFLDKSELPIVLILLMTNYQEYGKTSSLVTIICQPLQQSVSIH